MRLYFATDISLSLTVGLKMEPRRIAYTTSAQHRNNITLTSKYSHCDYYCCMPAAFTTAAHFTVSARRKVFNSCGVLATISAPSTASFSRI